MAAILKIERCRSERRWMHAADVTGVELRVGWRHMQGCNSSSSCSCVCRSSNQRTRRITLGRSADRPEKPSDSRRAPGWMTSRTRRISVIMTMTTTVYCKVPLAPPRGMGGKLPALWVNVQKLCNMRVLSLSWNFFVSHDKYTARPSSKGPRWYTDNTTGTGGLRTLDPL